MIGSEGTKRWHAAGFVGGVRAEASCCRRVATRARRPQRRQHLLLRQRQQLPPQRRQHQPLPQQCQGCQGQLQQRQQPPRQCLRLLQSPSGRRGSFCRESLTSLRILIATNIAIAATVDDDVSPLMWRRHQAHVAPLHLLRVFQVRTVPHPEIEPNKSRRCTARLEPGGAKRTRECARTERWPGKQSFCF